MSNSVASELRSAISTIRDKSAEVSDSDFFSDIAAGRVESAKSQIDFAKSGVQRNQMLLDDVNSKLNPPPTKEVSAGKSGTKTVVDQEEVRKLESTKRSVQAQLNDAKTSVEAAEQEAQVAAMESLEKAGISKDKQAELDAVLSQIDGIKDKMEKGEAVEDDEITGALGDLNKSMEGLENNGIVKESFYEPIEEDLKEILKYVENPVETEGNEEVIPPEGTIDRDLHDIGITGDENAELVGLMADLAEVSESLTNGEAVEDADLQAIYDGYMAKRQNFTSAQLTSGVISEFENSFDSLIDATGSNVSKIKAEAGTAG